MQLSQVFLCPLVIDSVQRLEVSLASAFLGSKSLVQDTEEAVSGRLYDDKLLGWGDESIYQGGR